MADGLDPRFIVTSDLESYFVNKQTGLPLAAGKVYFYSQLNPSVKKPVYQISTPSLTSNQYAYAALPNPSTLSSVGTFQDALGNNIVPYYFPFEGVPEDNSGVSELYYIEVYDSNDVLQFTRIAWPNNDDSVSATDFDVEKNYVPNGQFIAHNDHEPEAQNITDAPGGNVDYIPIAQGGWFLAKTHGGANTYNNSFTQIATPITPLNGAPRYAFNFICTSNSTDTVRDVVIRFAGVNTFSSTSGDALPFTFFFASQSNGPNFTFSIRLQYYFGSGAATPATDEEIGTVVIGSTYDYKPVTVIFPQQNGAIGANNDDFVQIAIRGPSSGSWNIAITDGGLVFREQASILSYPIKTEAEMMDESTAGWLPLPSPNNASLYLPIKLGPSGFIYDDSEIGTVVAKFNASASENELLCDGTSYVTSAYSTLGIPYSRLQAKLFNTTYGIPLFGTGENFINTYISTGSTDQLIFTTNKFNSPQANPIDGGTATGFNFMVTSNTNTGTAGYDFTGYANANAEVTAICNSAGAIFNSASASTGTSGMTGFVDYRQPSTSSGNYSFKFNTLSASALAAGIGAQGKYFYFTNTTTTFHMWFKVNGEIAPTSGPPTGTAIQCNLTSTMSAIDVANVIANVMQGMQTNAITTNNPPANSYFSVYANSQQYVIWYELDGTGIQPVVASAIYIKVPVTTGNTPAQVATATRDAMNAYSFSVPDLRGLFLRGFDSTGQWDASINSRFGANANNLLPSAVPGMLEIDSLAEHFHNITTNTASGTSTRHILGTAFNANPLSVASDSYGFSETRPVNMNVNYFIKY